MPRKLCMENVRVEVYPEVSTWSGDISFQREKADAEQLRKEIIRHVDCRDAVVNWDTYGVCSFCGAQWTESKSSTHNGGCCDEDCKNMPPEGE